MAAYKTTKDAKIFVINNENLNKLINDNCPDNIVNLIQRTYNLNSTLEQSIKDYREEYPHKNFYLYKS